MTRLALHVNGSRFELADEYTAADLARQLSAPNGLALTLDLANGGTVRFRATSALSWAVEEIP